MIEKLHFETKTIVVELGKDGYTDYLPTTKITFDYIKPTTKKAENIRDSVSYANKTLTECYGSYSIYKSRAYDWCYRVAIACAGVFGTYGIVSYNSMIFTYGFTFKRDNITYYCYITRDHNYITTD